MHTTWWSWIGVAFALTGCIEQSSVGPKREGPAVDAGVDAAIEADAETGEADADVGEPDAEIVIDAEAPEPDAAPEPELAGPGEACAGDEDCAEGRCLGDPTFPGGYCAVEDCDDDCAEGTACVTRSGGSLCAATCEAEGCRDGYICAVEGDQSVCLPPWAVEGQVDGAPCASDAQCSGGVCITDWPGGFCTTVNCTNREDCARGDDASVDNRCWVQNDPPFCVRMCEQQSDCRDDYVCTPVGRGQGVCYPDPSAPLLPPEAIAESPLGIECIEPDRPGRFSWVFDVAEATSSYMVVPFTEDGGRMEPVRIDGPAESVDFRGRNSFQSIPAALFGALNPTVVPATRQHADQLGAGEHTYFAESDASRMCWYQLEEASPGTTIDLNIYLVDVGISAASAARDANLNSLLDQFEAVYSNADIELGEVRYFDLSGEVAQRYAVIRSEGDVGAVLALTEPPGDTRDDVLSLNVVFVQTFALPGAGGVLGISPGLPGPAGLHGTPNSGVVFTAEFLGRRFRERSGELVDGNVYTGNVLAHEVGHYLGLFHTTEQDQRSTDPLPDTENCRGVGDFPFGCPDENNLMFPLAGANNSQVTPDQAAVIQANPLTKD